MKLSEHNALALGNQPCGVECDKCNAPMHFVNYNIHRFTSPKPVVCPSCGYTEQYHDIPHSFGNGGLGQPIVLTC